MHAILLAAGYATRLYPLTKDCPKTLLPVAGVPLLDYIVAKVLQIPDLQSIALVSNHRFYEHFANWLQWRHIPIPVRLIDDQTTDNDNRLGAIRDMQLAVTQADLDDDVLVLATDNLFAFDLAAYVRFAQMKNADTAVLQHEPRMEVRQRTGIAEVDDNQRITGFEEKPAEPKTCWRVPPFYYYKQETLPLLRTYLDEGHNPDAPGNFVNWLYQQKPVYGYPVEQPIIDIGNLEQYGEVNRTLTRETLATYGVRPWWTGPLD